LGGIGALFRVAKPTKAPRGDGTASTLEDLKFTRKRQSYHKLVNKHWNITSLAGKACELVEDVK